MTTIPLTQGRTALVDDADEERVVRHRWCAVNHTRGPRPLWYAMTRIFGRQVYLHRFVLSALPGQNVDHRNCDGLDCRRENLRLATVSQNLGNSRKARGKSRYKGVIWYPRQRRWRAQIGGIRKRWLGYFRTEEEAARAYDEAAVQEFGSFARTNASEGLL